MQYFGVPTCPYCKKRVNLIRTWSLKRQGEYRCPRCGGISNIYLSPLIYVFALLAVFAGVAIYFFHKYILNDIDLTTGIQVFIPFAVFFLLSLFMVYLAKPVIKKVPRSQVEGKKRGRAGSFEERRMPAAGTAGATGRVFYDREDYQQAPMDYRTGPMPRQEGDEDMKIVEPRQSRPSYNSGHTSVVAMSQDPAPRQSPAASRPGAAAPRQAAAPQHRNPAPAVPTARRAAQPAPGPARQAPQPARHVEIPSPVAQAPTPSARVVSSVEIPSVKDDFFAKYDDPDYINRRLEELKRERGEK